MKKNKCINHSFSEKRIKLISWILIFLVFLITNCFGLMQSDLNNDGYVDFIDMSIMASQWLREDANDPFKTQPVNMLDGTLTRDSIAFLEGKQYVAHSQRKKIMAVASPSDLEVINSINVDGVGAIANPIVHCISGGYLWASGPSPNYAGLYKSSDGINWTQIQDSGDLTGVYVIHPHSSGAIFVVKASADSFKLYKSLDGTDLLDSNMPAPKITFDTANGVCACTYFNFHEALDGVICVGEYRSQGKCWGLWRSIDGGDTFERVYTEADTRVKHSHRVYKQEASGRWVVVWGDGAQYNKTTYSDDDGVTWSDLETQTEYHFQPVEFYDYGHATRLLYGSDSSWGFGFYDVLTKQTEPLYWDMSVAYKAGTAGTSTRYSWAIMEHDGIFYGSTYNGVYSVLSADRRASIVVSDNLSNWTVYHQFTAGEYGIYRYLGVLNNKIHCILQNSTLVLQYARFSPCNVTQYNALCIDPATTNILSANESSMETDDSAWTCTGTSESYTAEAMNGSKCVQVTSTWSSEALRKSNGESVTAGTSYSGSIAMKSSATNACGQYSWIFTATYRETDRHVYGLGRDNWQTINLEPMTVAASGESYVNIFIRPNSADGALIPSPANFLLDCVQIEAGPPTRWQIGGIPRAYETLNKTYTFPDSWTEFIIWAPATRLDYFLPGWGNQYIKCWYKDGDNYLELYYDPSDFKFKLQATIEGQTQEVASTALTYKCYTNASVRLVVRGGQQFWLSINYAGDWEHLDSINAFDGIVGSGTGNFAGTNVISGSYLSDLMYNYCMIDEILEMIAE